VVENGAVEGDLPAIKGERLPVAVADAEDFSGLVPPPRQREAAGQSGRIQFARSPSNKKNPAGEGG
jgi:hypothetical protein